MSIVKNSPDMNIVNQINAALNDVRSSLLKLSDAKFPTAWIETKVRYQVDLAMTMVIEHRRGKSISWSDRRPLVEEEFS